MDLEPGLVALADNVAEEQANGPRKGERVAEIGGIAPRCRALLVVERAERAEAICCVAREDIPAARTAIFLETINLPASLSYHRKAGIPVLSPSRIPAWLADVCDDRSGSQLINVWDPSSIQRLSVGMYPLSIAWRRIGSANPSISRNRTPGVEDGGGDENFRLSGRTTNQS